MNDMNRVLFGMNLIPPEVGSNANMQNGLELFIRTSVVTPIVAHLQEKNVTPCPSADDLMGVLGFGGTAEQCQYRFVTRKKAGQQCPKKAVPGSLFCTVCGKKRAAKKQEEEILARLAPPDQETLPDGMPSPPPGINPDAKPAAFQVADIGPGLYLEKTLGILLRAGNAPDEYIAAGYLEDPDKPDAVTPLDEERLEFCRRHRLSTVEPTDG